MGAMFLLPQDEEIRRLHETLSLATSEAKDSGRALLGIVRKLCTVFHWAFGEAWVPSRDGSVLKPGPAWPRANADYTNFRMASRRLGFLPGGGLPGKVWRNRNRSGSPTSAPCPSRVSPARASR